MAVVIFIYLLLNVSLIGSVGAAVLAASPAPLATAAGLFLPGAAPVVAVVGIIAMLSALNAYIIGASRILQNISSVYRIPVLSEISRRGTPATALVLGSGIAAGALFFSNHFDLLASISVITNLLPYIAFCLAAFLLFHEPMRRAVAGTGIVITSLILVLYFLL
jgi:L-asparagine transporter-like permease